MSRRYRAVVLGAVTAVTFSTAVAAVAVADTAPPPAGGFALRPDGASVERVLDIVSRVVDLKASATKLEQGNKTQLNLDTDVLFEFGSAQLSPKAQQTLQTAADAIKAGGAARVQVDGYTDSVGDDASNLELSRQRSQAVTDALTPLVGAGKVNFAVQGHGEADPIAPNADEGGADNPAGRALNRRVSLSYSR